jgi:hypothetical protein
LTRELLGGETDLVPLAIEVQEYDDGVWRGCVVAAPQRELLVDHIWTTFVAGVRHHPEGTWLEPGVPVRLVPEPDNPYDPHAVSVWTEEGLQAGWLPRVTTEHLDLSIVRHGLVLSEMRVEDVRIGLWILVSRDLVELVATSEPASMPGHVRHLVDRLKKDALTALGDDAAPLDPMDAMRQMFSKMSKEKR